MQKCGIQADCVTPFHTLQRTQSPMIESVDQQYTASDVWGDLKGARFDACTFHGVNWSEKDLRGARFENCTWVDCDFRAYLRHEVCCSCMDWGPHYLHFP